MSETMTPPSDHADREIVMTRLFDAPRELVYAAYTDPKHTPRWWGPRGFTVTTHSADMRVGGEWRFDMVGPDGTRYPNRILYLELTEPSRIVFAYDEGRDDDPERFQVTVTFEAVGQQTRVVQRSLFSTAAQRAAVVGFGAIELGQTTLDKLGEHLAHRRLVGTTHFVIEPGERTIHISRVFEAHRELVFRVWTQPEHLARWYGPCDSTLTECTIDLRVDGRWRHVLRMKDGSEHAFRGTYREITPPARLVTTMVYEPFPHAEAVETVTFEDLGVRTRVSNVVLHQSVENRDAHVASRMEYGAADTMDRFATLLASLAAS